jgi:hypothetical protein
LVVRADNFSGEAGCSGGCREAGASYGECVDATSGTQQATFRGHYRYAAKYPLSRWAGQGGINTARLSVTDSAFVITPVKLARVLLRMPVLRIPFAVVESVWGIHWGIKFVTPTRPDLDGTYFKSNSASGARELAALVKSLGIPVETMPWRDRLFGFFQDFATQMNGGRYVRSMIRRR